MNDANNAGALAPCPFCGGTPVYPDYDAGDDDFVVTCKDCGASSRYSDKQSDVIAAWNTRALSTPNAPVEQREAIALDHLGNALYYAAAIHPDHRNQAIENAIAYYNAARPNAQVDPNEHASLRTYDPILAGHLDEAAIRKDEREKCAKIADDYETTSHFGIVAKRAIAGKIRNGGKQP